MRCQTFWSTAVTTHLAPCTCHAGALTWSSRHWSHSRGSRFTRSRYRTHSVSASSRPVKSYYQHVRSHPAQASSLPLTSCCSPRYYEVRLLGEDAEPARTPAVALTISCLLFKQSRRTSFASSHPHRTSHYQPAAPLQPTPSPQLGDMKPALHRQLPPRLL